MIGKPFFFFFSFFFHTRRELNLPSTPFPADMVYEYQEWKATTVGSAVRSRLPHVESVIADPPAYWHFDDPAPASKVPSLKDSNRLLTASIEALFTTFSSSMETSSPERRTPEGSPLSMEKLKKKTKKKKKTLSSSSTNSSLNLSIASTTSQDSKSEKKLKKRKKSKLGLSAESIPEEMGTGEKKRKKEKRKESGSAEDLTTPKKGHRESKNTPVDAEELGASPKVLDDDEEYGRLRRRKKSSQISIPSGILEEEEEEVEPGEGPRRLSSPDLGGSTGRVSNDLVRARGTTDNDDDEDLNVFAERYLYPRRSTWRESVDLPLSPVDESGRRVSRVSFSYQARRERELSFVEGAILLISPDKQEDNGAFVEAECNGRVGLVPVALVERPYSFQDRRSSLSTRKTFEELLEQVPPSKIPEKRIRMGSMLRFWRRIFR